MPAGESSEEEAEEGVGTLAEGRTEEVDAVPAALHEDAVGVAERSEALDAVVVAHAALADAAEGKVVLRDVHDDSVDGDVAGRGAVEDLARSGPSLPATTSSAA